jgi:hypothetical protein
MWSERQWDVSAFVLACLPACAADGDAKSRELVAISHLAAEPVGSVSISDDRTYVFVSSTTKSESRGTLSPAEFDTLKAHVARSTLDALYTHRDADPDRCEVARDSYFLTSAVGTACFVLPAITDTEARAKLAFFAQLFQQKAATAR